MKRPSTLFALLACVVVFSWGALPYLPGQIDDAFIVYAYAHRFLDHGELAWNTGERVEGYSSPLHLLSMIVAAAAGLDLSVASRVLSWLGAVGVLVVLVQRRFGPGRLLVGLAVAAWQPFQYWSVGGLETTLGALIATVAWPLVLGSRAQWASGTLLCMLFSLTRPEGAAWLALALVRGLMESRRFGRPEKVVAAALVGLAGYHLLRTWYFGALLPTPYLVKVAGARAWGDGAGQLLREMSSAGAILGALALLRMRPTAWVVVPILIQAAVLVRAGGDWMGHARFMLPGVLASVAGTLACGEPRGKTSWLPMSVVLLGTLLGFVWEPSKGSHQGGGFRDGWYLRHPMAALRDPWATPMLGETSFLIAQVPAHAGAYISDVGLPGNIDDIRIWDAAGLTDRLVAEVVAGRHVGLPPGLRARYEDDDDVWCMRYGLGPEGEETADPWLRDLLPQTYPSRSGQRGEAGPLWRCRPGTTPSSQLIADRWQHLADRFPSQDWIRWHQARALLTLGSFPEAMRVASEAHVLGKDGFGWVLFGSGQDGGYISGRGWALYANGELRSVVAPYAFWRSNQLRLDVDDPGEDGARVRVEWSDDCSPPVDVMVHRRATFDFPPCDRFGERSLIVDFSNDEARPGFDRNLYVALSPR